MDETEHQILDYLKHEEGMITDIALAVKKDRHTIAKYLESMQSKGLLVSRIRGKAKLWKKGESTLVHTLKNNTTFTNDLRTILSESEDHIIIKTKSSTLLENKKSKGSCFINVGNTEKCSGCIVEKSFANGKKMTKKINNYTIVAKPIIENNKIVAVIEIIKKQKNRV